jgi:DNA-binding XRE family transcriptional regulator
MNAQGFIYAIRSAGHVKIGWSSNPRYRVSQVRVHCPFPCELVGFYPGSMADEAALHVQFAAYRRSGEWFDLQGPVLEWMQGVTLPPREVDATGAPLRVWRKQSRLTQIELADLLGVCHAQIAHIEAGRNGPSLELALKIRDLAGDAVPLESLLPVYEAAQ